ncbi:MAG: glutamate--tRNA ligase [Candidatus Woesearchaeota archaeon]
MDKELIRKYALQNAVKFKGKANQGAVIGKVLSEKPGLKDQLKDLIPSIQNIIKEVNKLGLDKQKSDLESIAPGILEKKKEVIEKALPELKDAKKGDVIMRFEPSPSGPLHIGHAYVLSLNSEFCRKYKGKLILRIGDTNTENIYEPSYKMIVEDAKWLTGNNIHDILVQSGRLDLYYGYMEKLLEINKVYVCTCDPEKFKELIKKKIPCPCRELGNDEQRARWKRMFKGYKKGDAVVRLKTDLNDKNPAMRDFPLFRINDSSHPKTKKKYRVWPLMNMAVAVDDIDTNVTHVIRAKDHQDNALRQRMIYQYLGLEDKFPEALFVGRINFEGMPVSCSKTRIAIDEGKYSGWDDIRLPFLPALRKRGYQPGAFVKYAIDVGISLTDKKVPKDEFFKSLNAFNKDVIDKKSSRYFFILDPVNITVENAPVQSLKLDLHPENKKGGRSFKTDERFYIAKEDKKNIKRGELYRLMDCLNFSLEKSKYRFDSLDYERYKEQGKMIMHWLPVSKELFDIKVLMDDNTKVKGLGETNLDGIKIGDIIQFERFGFCRLEEKKNNKMLFYWLHK